MKFKVLLLLSLFAVVGCASKVWYQPGKTSAETQRDLTICRGIAASENTLILPNPNNTTVIVSSGNDAATENALAAQQSQNGMANLAAVLTYNSRKNELIAGLMAERGYIYIRKSEIVRSTTNSAVNLSSKN